MVRITAGSLNSWIVPMIDSRTASNAAPRINGILIFVVICQPLAPSIRAAS